MSIVKVYRKDKVLRGKELSANTIAGFMVAQNVKAVAELDTERRMSLDLLRFLLREIPQCYPTHDEDKSR